MGNERPDISEPPVSESTRARLGLPALHHWNHRVLCITETILHEEYKTFSIHEVHYDADGNALAYGEDPEPVLGESLDDLRWSLDKMREALDKPVLTPADFSRGTP